MFTAFNVRLPRVAGLVTAMALVVSLMPSAARAAAPTEAPEILAPAPGESSSSNPVLKWAEVAGAVEYKVQVSTNSSFTSLVWDKETFSLATTPSSDLPPGILYWRVAATDGGTGVGPYSESNFQRTIPVAPALISPSDEEVLTYPGEPPVFSWQPIAGAKTYKLEIDDAPDFIGAASYTTNNTSYAPLEPQTIGQSFYWRVQGVGSTGVNSEWSATRSYTIDWPSVPVLKSPANDTIVPVEDVALDWDPVVGAASYQLQVSPNGDWANNKTIDVVVDSTRYSHQPTLSQPIFNNGSYFWRVRARDNKATPNLGGWSEEWQFTRGWPDKPTLISPVDGDLNVPQPSFEWTPVDHASHYEIQLSTDPFFSPDTFQSCYTNHTEFTAYRLAPGHTAPTPGTCHGFFNTFSVGQRVYWRVRGIDAPGAFKGIWSDASSFIYKTTTPTVLGPANGATVETPVLRWESVPDISHYEVTVLKGSGSLLEKVVTHATSFTPTKEMEPDDGPYTWYVRTRDMEGRLGLAPADGSQPIFNLADPASTSGFPHPVAPADGASDLDMPAMSWEPVTGADHYKVMYGLEGSGVVDYLSGPTKLYQAGYTHMGEPLPSGNYFWYVNAYSETGAFIAQGSQGTFTVTDLPTVTYEGPAKCEPGQPCAPLADTPTLEWQRTPKTDHYRVYLANDANFTNIIREYETQFTQLTPRESLLDNQAGQAYYWFVRPCKSESRCGVYDNSVFPNAFAFRKRSAPIDLLSPADGQTVANQVTLNWQDYLTTNGALADPVTQEAKQYRVQVSTVADFATLVDEAVVDQTTYTAPTETYPEGPLYWRVQAIDGSNNDLTFSPVRSLVKQSPQVTLNGPNNGALVGGVPFFSWNPQSYAAKYEIELYKNGDTQWSPVNRVLTSQTKMAAWAPTSSLPAGVYAWRVRRQDADSRPGPWSAGRTFMLEPGAPALVGPVDAADLRRNEILFQWNHVQGATNYRIEVSNSSTFASTVESQKTVMNAWAPLRKYTDGTYYWRVRTLDAADNAGPASEVRSFTVTTPAPGTDLTSGPSGIIKSTSATFEFSSDAGAATFQCSLDGAQFSNCTSAKTYSNLAQGSHSFEVRAVNEGIVDPSPARREWTVSSIEISKIVFKAKKLNGEYVQLHNEAATTVSLSSWQLKDKSGITYRFSSLSLPAGGFVKIHSGKGSNTSRDLYWNRRKQVWGDAGDKATLKRSDKTVADTCSYRRGGTSTNCS